MRAKIIAQELSGTSGLDVAYPGGSYTRQLLVPGANNLVITLWEDRMCAYTGFDLNGGHDLLGEVDIPLDLVEKGAALVRAQAALDETKSVFQALVGSGR